MSEAVSISAAKPFSRSRALVAGLIATVLITISLALFGMNIMKSLGGMMLPNATIGVQYLVGGLVHLMIGLFYGAVYAWLFGRVTEWNPVLKGVVFGLAITAIALAAMPILASMMGAGGAAGPCSPCAAKAAATPCGPCTTKETTPCNPCAPKSATTPCNPCTPKSATTPCNPCAPKSATTPCNPCAPKSATTPCNPCAPKSATTPCSPCAAKGGPCSPCGGGGQGPYSGLVSVINHLIYALTLAFVYRTRPAA